MEDFKWQSKSLNTHNIQGDVAKGTKEVTQFDLCLRKLAFLGCERCVRGRYSVPVWSEDVGKERGNAIASKMGQTAWERKGRPCVK